jgi:hypothetical protein
MDDLVAWLRQQLDEDARVAKELAKLRPQWSVGGGYPETGPTRVIGVDDYVIVEDDTDWAAEIVTHIARHDPASVLREVEAKRLIIDTAVWFRDRAAQVEGERVYDMDDMRENLRLEVTARVLANTLSVIAAVYSDRPGYREEWRP